MGKNQFQRARHPDDCVRATLASGVSVKGKATSGGGGEEEGGKEEDSGESPLNMKTALKFGKLGAILVFADVVTFFVMGRSVLGVMDDGGEEGWKEKMADQILERSKAKDAASAAAAGGGDGGGEDGEENDKQQPPSA